MQRNKFQDSEVRKQAALSLTCDDDGEAGGVDAGGDLLRRGPGAEPARAGLPGDERQDAHLKPRRQETPKLTIQHCTPQPPKPKQEHAKKLSHRNATEFDPPPPKQEVAEKNTPRSTHPRRTDRRVVQCAGAGGGSEAEGEEEVVIYGWGRRCRVGRGVRIDAGRIRKKTRQKGIWNRHRKNRIDLDSSKF